MSTPFDTAVADSKKLTSKPGNDELLELYGAFCVLLYESTIHIATHVLASLRESSTFGVIHLGQREWRRTMLHDRCVGKLRESHVDSTRAETVQEQEQENLEHMMYERL
jgi:hypothetical protein